MTRRVVVVGCGAVGLTVARHLASLGDHVTGTTTTEAKIRTLLEVCDAAVVVRGSDTSAVHEVLAHADAAVVCVSPPEAGSATVEDRASVYREALVATAQSVASAPSEPVIAAISSLSVYGAAADHDFVDEATPLPELVDPSPRAYREMEEAYLDLAPGRAAVLRTGDIVSPGDPTLEEKVAFAHKFLSGSVPFDDRALAYRLAAEQVAKAFDAVLTAKAAGVINVVSTERPPTNAELYGASCDRAGVPKLDFRRELVTPHVEVRPDRLTQMGVALEGALWGRERAPG